MFTLLFTFSGFYHATTKLKDEHYNVSAPKHYHTASINFNFNNIASAVHQAISNIQLATIDTTTYWQVYIKAKQPLNKQEKKTKDLMKEMNVQAPVVVYINTSSNNILSNGENYMLIIWLHNSPIILQKLLYQILLLQSLQVNTVLLISVYLYGG